MPAALSGKRERKRLYNTQSTVCADPGNFSFIYLFICMQMSPAFGSRCVVENWRRRGSVFPRPTLNHNQSRFKSALKTKQNKKPNSIKIQNRPRPGHGLPPADPSIFIVSPVWLGEWQRAPDMPRSAETKPLHNTRSFRLVLFPPLCKIIIIHLGLILRLGTLTY